MERSQPVPQKCNSFSSSSSATREDKLNALQRSRNLSLGAIRYEGSLDKKEGEEDIERPDRIDEGEEDESPEHENELEHQPDLSPNENQEEEEQEEEEEEPAPEEEEEEAPVQSRDLATVIDEVDQFLETLTSFNTKEGGKNDGDGDGDDDGHENEKETLAPLLPEIHESTVGMFIELIEDEIAKLETPIESEHRDEVGHQPSFLDAVDRVSKLTTALSRFASSDHKYLTVMSSVSTVLHHAMCYLEDELYTLLEESSHSVKDHNSSTAASKTKRPPSFGRSVLERGVPASHEPEKSTSSPSAEPNAADFFPLPAALSRLRAIAGAMITAGYETECRQVFAVARRNAFKSSLNFIGFEKVAIDDVQRMPWESLESEIAKWIKTFRQAVTVSLPLERELCFSVFSGPHHHVAASIFRQLACATTLQYLNFPEAVVLTKRSAEKLFKVLDMYEAFRDTIPKIDLLFPEGDANESSAPSSSIAIQLKFELSMVQARLGEAAVSIFSELENSIRSDAGKNAVPGGAVHPLTRYVINYLKYACEYMNTLELIFKQHNNPDDDNDSHKGNSSNSSNRAQSSSGSSQSTQSAFEAQLEHVMDLLQHNLDSKAKLYKDLALSNIFLMNNGRYIVQKIKGSPEMNKLLGNTWCRKRSSELRQYHKNYRTETWTKVLACFKEDGLTVKGSVSKPVLKERFKSFNALFDEIHRVQSTWVVSDEQLQSELRVSVSAVVVPAYRSFLGRFQQYFTAGRQTEKYVKFGPEELETMIDELFDGNPQSMVRRRT